jgi:hypothetical protein
MRNRRQRFGRRFEQGIIDGGLVVEGDLGDRRRRGEDDVVIHRPLKRTDGMR